MIISDFKFWEFFVCVLALVAVNACFSNKKSPYAVLRQNLILLLASYYFYAQWDWRLLGLLAGVTIIGFVAGLKIERSSQARAWLVAAVTLNLVLLGFFKYYGFFVDQGVALLAKAGVTVHPLTLNLVLPIGISFYILQTISYLVDVSRRKISATRNAVAYATSIAFFPKLVTGPIERSSALLPQFDKLWRFDTQQIVQGLQLILFGLVLKICVADNLSPYVDKIFADPSAYNGGVLAMGILYYTFQIYGDFCGYSAIALGAAKILGIELMTNFDTPYFATSIRDFWRRWHISLSTFFRDYVYIPLGGSKEGMFNTYRNLMLTFLLSGFWHGANWTFIMWGGYHGALLCVNQITAERLKRFSGSRVFSGVAWIITFVTVSFGWLFFRSDTIAIARDYSMGMVSRMALPDQLTSGVNYIILVIIIDMLWYRNPRLDSTAALLKKWQSSKSITIAVFTILFWLIIFNYRFATNQEFIYFKF